MRQWYRGSGGAKRVYYFLRVLLDFAEVAGAAVARCLGLGLTGAGDGASTELSVELSTKRATSLGPPGLLTTAMGWGAFLALCF